jgi:hypothetical protein
MKKLYITPYTSEQTVNIGNVICASGGGGGLTIMYPGGTSTPTGGDAADAF